LKGIGLYALGDARIACTLLQQSLAAERNAATLLYVGACRALERNDRDAIEAWGEALAGEVPAAIPIPLIMRAYLRLGEPARAIEIAQRLVTSGAPATSIVSATAAAHIAEGREEDAIAMLLPYLATHPDDLDAQYSLLHALFAGFVRGQGVGATPDGRERFRRMARAYVEADGRNAGAVREWLAIMP
jgi:tetratricopeptide (TPR) repeat protein